MKTLEQENKTLKRTNSTLKKEMEGERKESSKQAERLQAQVCDWIGVTLTFIL